MLLHRFVKSTGRWSWNGARRAAPRGVRGARLAAAAAMIGLLLASCEQEPTPIPTRVVTAAPPELGSPTASATSSLPTTLPTAAPTEQPTFTPIATAATAATPTRPPLPTATTRATATPPGDATPAATALPVGELLLPGQTAAGTMAADQVALFPVQATRARPLLFFVEPSADLDVTLSVHPGVVEDPAALDDAPAITEAEQSGDGRPEIIVFSPAADGTYTVAVRANPQAAGTQGSYVLYLFDTHSAAPGATFVTGGFAAGLSASHPVTSSGGRPVICFLDPTDSSDLILRALDSAGQLLTEANFSGPGAAEAVYLLPLATTSYICEVTEANGQAASYELALIALP